jgi:hypothetical protein
MADTKKRASEFWQVGEPYFIRTVTHYLTGRLVALDDHELILTDAAWIADTGRYAMALATGSLAEVEPYPAASLVAVGRSALIDATVWPHPLPRETK